jgi:hypothetical protein
LKGEEVGGFAFCSSTNQYISTTRLHACSLEWHSTLISRYDSIRQVLDI